jgi:3-deoxy-D-arabino-heptulosonate 7-phosphate (DAHP) synthase
MKARHLHHHRHRHRREVCQSKRVNHNANKSQRVRQVECAVGSGEHVSRVANKYAASITATMRDGARLFIKHHLSQP